MQDVDESAEPPGTSAIRADAALMALVARADAQAWRQVVDRHLGPLQAFAWRLLGDRADAEDVAQDAFLQLWRQARRWQPKARISTWLHRVAYNASIDRLRRRRPQAELSDSIADDDRPGPSDARLRREVADRVNTALADLPERQRAAIALVHYQELSGADAAAILDISVEALESLLARGRRALRAALADQRRDLLGEL